MNNEELDLFVNAYNNYTAKDQLSQTYVGIVDDTKQIDIFINLKSGITMQLSFDFNDPNLKRFNFNNYVKHFLLFKMAFRNSIDDIQIDFTPENIFSVAKFMSNINDEKYNININIHELKRYLQSDEDILKFDLLYGSI